jgi:uncharacterized membrane protein
MPKTTKAVHYPLSGAAKALILSAFIINLLALFVVAYYYPSLPNVTPTHYGINGAPNSYGNKSSLLIIPGIFIALFVFLVLILRFRYTLLEKYPYLLNLPSFVYVLGTKTSPSVQGEVINRVFSVFSLSVLYVSLLNLTISLAIMRQDAYLLLPSVLAIIAVFIASVLLLYRSIYRRFAKSS